MSLSRKPPTQDTFLIRARGVDCGSLRETRVSGVRTASLRLSRDSELILNQVLAPAPFN